MYLIDETAGATLRRLETEAALAAAATGLAGLEVDRKAGLLVGPGVAKHASFQCALGVAELGAARHVLRGHGRRRRRQEQQRDADGRGGGGGHLEPGVAAGGSHGIGSKLKSGCIW